ncbi:MAG: Smr/MutS family protein [Chloroflexota bacterium]
MDEPVLDLHGLRVAQAVNQTNAFLLAEQERGSISVRIITGHGTGALKQAIREVLSKHPAVASSLSALRSDAATLVVLRPRPHR